MKKYSMYHERVSRFLSCRFEGFLNTSLAGALSGTGGCGEGGERCVESPGKAREEAMEYMRFLREEVKREEAREVMGCVVL